MPAQLRIDFNRGVQLRWLHDLVIPPFVRDHGPAAGRVCRSTHRHKNLLRSIDDHARTAATCRLRLSTLATCMGCSIDTLLRAIADLEQLELLSVSHEVNRWNTFSINWVTVEKMLPTTSATPPPGSQLAGPGSQLAALGSQVATPYHKRHQTHGNKRHGADGSLKNGTTKSSNGGWPWPITLERMSSATGIQTLFEHAVTREWISDHHRLWFFSLVHSCVRRSRIKGTPQKAPAWLTGILRRPDWTEKIGDQSDEAWARSALKLLDYNPATSRREANLEYVP